MNKKLKPCPFCGGKTKIQIVNNEGNFNNKDYKNDSRRNCMYDIEEEAIQAWIMKIIKKIHGVN